MKRLIINADDFGLAPGVNRAIVELQQAGALSSATLMANGPYFSPAVYMAFAQPALAVGCHVVLVDGSPCLRPDEVPSLLDPLDSSSFRITVGSFISDLLRGRIRGKEIEAEAVAQIRRIQSSGLTVSHIDSHKHLHAFPAGAGSSASGRASLRSQLRSQSVRARVESARHPKRRHRATPAGTPDAQPAANVLQANKGTRHAAPPTVLSACWLRECSMTQCCAPFFEPCQKARGSWFAILDILTVLLNRHALACGQRERRNAAPCWTSFPKHSGMTKR